MTVDKSVNQLIVAKLVQTLFLMSYECAKMSETHDEYQPQFSRACRIAYLCNQELNTILYLKDIQIIILQDKENQHFFFLHTRRLNKLMFGILHKKILKLLNLLKLD